MGTYIINNTNRTIDFLKCPRCGNIHHNMPLFTFRDGNLVVKNTGSPRIVLTHWGFCGFTLEPMLSESKGTVQCRCEQHVINLKEFSRVFMTVNFTGTDDFEYTHWGYCPTLVEPVVTRIERGF